VVRSSDATGLNCTAPAGYGAPVELQILVFTFRVGGEGLFAYGDPKISSIQPVYVLAGAQTIDFTILGSNLGSSIDEPDSLSIGGVPCGNIDVFSSNEVRCYGLSQTQSEWSTSVVRLQAGN